MAHDRLIDIGRMLSFELVNTWRYDGREALKPEERQF